jgi:hypothetical protein
VDKNSIALGSNMKRNELFYKIIKKIKLESLIVQYFIGLFFCIILMVILLSTNITYNNLQVPEGDYKENLWKGSDVITYVQPARNFISTGTFEFENYISPYQRTIGYPLFLLVLMKLFGTNWLIWAYFAQAAIIAFIFPTISKICYIIFPDKKPIAVAALIFFLFAGTYWTMTPAILTDAFFTTFFTIGLCFGLLSIVKQDWKYLILHLLFIGYAAQVRPTVLYYPFVNILILAAIAKKYNILSKIKVKKIIIISTIILLIACNIPSMRNYVIYGYFKPTTVLNHNLFNILGKNVLTDKGETELFKTMEEETEKINNVKDIKEHLALKQKYAFEIYKKYPLNTVKQMLKRAAVIMGESHFTLVANYWDYDWMDKTESTWAILKKSNFVIAFNVFYGLIYIFIYIVFISFLIRLLKLKKFLYAFAIILFVAYFMFPTFIAGGGFRNRLIVEGIIVMFSFYEIGYNWKFLKLGGKLT